MWNLCRLVQSSRTRLLVNLRYLSVNKSELIQSSQTIEKVVKSVDENCPTLKWFSLRLNEIHEEYPSTKIGTASKNIYQKNSSKFNSTFLQLENDRRKQIEFFDEQNEKRLIILLRYIRYLQVAFIYRLITFEINDALKETSNSILNLTKNSNHFKEKFVQSQSSLSLICELMFFVKYFSSEKSLSQMKKLLSKTLIVDYLSENFFGILCEDSPVLLVEELSSTLHSIMQIPSIPSIDLWPCAMLNYLLKKKCNSLKIIEYLILIQHHCVQQNSSELISILNQYLMEKGMYQRDFYIICQLLILIASANYSHQLFHKEVLLKIENSLKKSREGKEKSDLSDLKLCCRLIYYLCVNDPTNRFASRSTIVELSKKLDENLGEQIDFPQWIVQAQHGMMLSDIYNYQLLFSVVQQKYFPLLFRDLGVYSSTIYRQLFDIHYALSVDRPTLQTPFLNPEMLSFATKISNEYRSAIRPNQNSYNRFLIDLKDSFNSIYGNNACNIINTDENYPYILFDFLQLTLPDREELKAIGINTRQRIAILPIFNSMLIRQQRSNGSLVRVLSAHTTMRYRLIEKNDYQVLPVFHGEYLRAIRNKTIKTIFETHLALKRIPHQSDNDPSLQF